MKFSIERKITIWFLMVSVIGMYFTFQTFKSRSDYMERGKWVKHSYMIQSEIKNINNFMQQMEIQSHHYLLTGREECVAAYNMALDSLNKSTDHFAELTKDNPRQQELLKILHRLNNRKKERNQASFQSLKKWGGLIAIKKVAEGYNQNLIDSLKTTVDRMNYEEDRLLDERMMSRNNASQKSIESLIIMVALFLLVVGIFYWLILDDIKKRKIAELKLQKNEAFLFMIFNEAKDALFIINSETNLIANCNKAAVEMFDVKDKNELLNSFGPRFHKIPFEEKDLLEINAAMEKEGVWKSEIEYLTNSGREFWGAFSVNAFEFNSETHRLIRITDITDKKKSEQIFRKYAEELEESKSKLYSLTSELLAKNNELKKSEAALKELNAGKDKFFSILAHDMRSPFTGLLGMSQYIADYNDVIPQGEIKELSGAIYGSAKKVYGLLTNLLEWSRFQMGKIEYLPSEVSLFETAGDILDLLQTNVSSKYISVKNEISSELNVFADQNMVSTIFRNLISNAIKFTNIGGEITLSAEIKDLSAEIKVRDNGIGMSDDVKERIFRIDSKYTTKGTSGEEGTGLGLVLCKELIEKNKGQISVESRPAGGTEFIFTLPLALDYKEKLLEDK